jgi:hypothetical protein
LTDKEKQRVQQQEIEFGREKDRARERLAVRQLGEHGAKAPVVKSSLQSTGFSDNGRKGSGPPVHVMEGKRKRDEAPPGAPRGPKAQRISEGAATGQSSAGDVTPHPHAQERSAANVAGRSVTLDSGRAGNATRPGPRIPPIGVATVKKKRPTDDDMFLKKK